MLLRFEIQKGTKIVFPEEKQKYTVRAVGKRYAVCTKPMNAKKTVMYTVCDFEEEVRGTEDLVFGMGAETDEECDDMLKRLEGELEERQNSEVSHRNRIDLIIKKISNC